MPTLKESTLQNKQISQEKKATITKKKKEFGRAVDKTLSFKTSITSFKVLFINGIKLIYCLLVSCMILRCPLAKRMKHDILSIKIKDNPLS